MAITHRPYADEADLTLLLKWISAECSPQLFIHPGDLVWWLRQYMHVDPQVALELFFDDSQSLQGFVFSDPVTRAVIAGKTTLPDETWDELVTYAIAKAGESTDDLVIGAHEWDARQLAALNRAGLAPTSERSARLIRTAEAPDKNVVHLPDGFHFTDMHSGEISPETRVELHQDIWSPSKVTIEAYDRLQAAPLYQPDLDVVIIAPSGEPVAYAIGWYDPGSRTGLMEPVGTRQAFRRQGLGKKLIQEMTRRLASLGAEKIMIGTSESNVAAVALYQSAGYSLSGYWVDYKLQLK